MSIEREQPADEDPRGVLQDRYPVTFAREERTMADAPQSTSAGGFETTPPSMPLAEAVELVLKQHAMREHRDGRAGVTREEWRDMARWLRDTLQRVYVETLIPVVSLADLVGSSASDGSVPVSDGAQTADGHGLKKSREGQNEHQGTSGADDCAVT